MILGIYGSGGLGREVHDIAVRRNAVSSLWGEILFINDFDHEGSFLNTRRIRLGTLLRSEESCECVIAVGEPATREKLYLRLKEDGVKLTTLIDPTALVSPTAKIEEGAILCEYVTIHCGAELGRNTLIQPFCNIGHDIKIGDNCVISSFFAPGGGSVFGARVYAGMQSSVLEKVTVGDDAIIGMGSAVFRDVPAGATVVGNPARITRGNDEHRVFAR